MYLVSAVYVCELGYRILAHDQRILDMLPCKNMVPFVLVHKSGFTSNFVCLCASLCQNGMNFHSLEGVIHHRCWEFFESRRSIYQTLHSISTHEEHHSYPTLCFPTFKEFGEKYLPSDDIIRKCFLPKFLEEEVAYINDIQSVSR